MELRTWLPHVVHSAKSDSGQQVQFARKTIRTQKAHSHAFPDADFSPPLAECQARALAGPVLCRPSAYLTMKTDHMGHCARRSGQNATLPLDGRRKRKKRPGRPES